MAILTLFLCAFLVLTLTDPSSSADSHLITCILFRAFPVLTSTYSSSSYDSNLYHTNGNCVLSSHGASGKCIPCMECSLLSRLPKPVGNRQNAKSFSVCEGCIPGYAFKVESCGWYSRRCIASKEVSTNLVATSATSTASPVSENSSSSGYIALGSVGLCLFVLVFCAAFRVPIRLWRRCKLSMGHCAEYEVYQLQTPCEDNFHASGHAPEPFSSEPETSRGYAMHFMCEQERLTQVQVTGPPNDSRTERPGDIDEPTGEDDLHEEDQHSDGSAVTVHQDEEDCPRGLGLNEQTEAVVEESSAFLISQEQLSFRRSTPPSPAAQTQPSPRSCGRISSRTLSEGDANNDGSALRL